MPSYTAPVEDMMFLFEKLRNNEKYNELEKYKEVTSDLVKDILQLSRGLGDVYKRQISLYFLLFLNLSKRNIISSTGAL